MDRPRRRRRRDVGSGDGRVPRPGTPVTVRDRWRRRRPELEEIAERSRNVVLLSAIVGSITGVLVAAFEWSVAEKMVARLLELPLWFGASAPTLGLVGAWVAL